MQLRRDAHTSRQASSKETFELEKRTLGEGKKRFFKLFEESTFEGSRATAQIMTRFAKRQRNPDKRFLLFHSLRVLIRSSNSEMLSWPNGPLLVMLQFVDPNVLFGDEESSVTLLHNLAVLADPSEYFTHVNQLILAKQLVEHGANVNAVSIPGGLTPLHKACFSDNVINLDFVEYLLGEGADPNVRDHCGRTPLMFAIPDAPGAAKCLLNWPNTDINITTRSGASFLALVCTIIRIFSDKVAVPDNPEQIQHQLVLQQWREIEGMLLERGALDTGITTLCNGLR
jgi:hypothetical protein